MVFWNRKLNNIIVSPKNNRFIFTEDKNLVCKKDENIDSNDILLFTPYNLEQINIPSSIKIISPYAFYSCKSIQKINIPTNSNIQNIGKFAFSRANIEIIFTPKTVSLIDQCAFCSCKILKNVEIQSDFAFAHSAIEKISIP